MPTSEEMRAGDRTLSWDGCLNVRDLGGLPIEGGGVTRSAAILRADSIRKLTDAGWQALLEYGVACILDLRFHSELADDPPKDVPIDVIHISVLPEPDAEVWHEMDAIGDAEADAAAGTRAVYLEFLERYGPKFAEAVDAVANAPQGPVVIHCVGGKDRTGLVSALVLRLAGVSVADVAADYALSEENLRSEAAEWIGMATTQEERSHRERRSHTPPQAMMGVLEEIEHRYGSVAAYLRANGASAPGLQKVIDRLMG
jgi:protein-tyrosine phosphatase